MSSLASFSKPFLATSSKIDGLQICRKADAKAVRLKFFSGMTAVKAEYDGWIDFVRQPLPISLSNMGMCTAYWSQLWDRSGVDHSGLATSQHKKHAKTFEFELPVIYYES